MNPIEKEEPYPWMAYLLTQEWKEPTKQDDAKPSTCTGAVLTRRYNNDIKTVIKRFISKFFGPKLTLQSINHFVNCRSIITAGHCICVKQETKEDKEAKQQAFIRLQ